MVARGGTPASHESRLGQATRWEPGLFEGWCPEPERGWITSPGGEAKRNQPMTSIDSRSSNRGTRGHDDARPFAAVAGEHGRAGPGRCALLSFWASAVAIRIEYPACATWPPQSGRDPPQCRDVVNRQKADRLRAPRDLPLVRAWRSTPRGETGNGSFWRLWIRADGG